MTNNSEPRTMLEKMCEDLLACEKVKAENQKLKKDYEWLKNHLQGYDDPTIIKLQQENERLIRVIAKELTENDELGCEYTYVNALKDQIKMLTEALEFYGDEGNYNWHYYGQDKQRVSDEVTEDGGKRARETLAKLRQGGG